MEDAENAEPRINTEQDVLRLTRFSVTRKLMEVLVPQTRTFSPRCMEKGYGGHPILLPLAIWPGPHRMVPHCYWDFSLSSGVFLLGAWAAIYIYHRNGVLYDGFDFELANYFVLDQDGLEIGGNIWDWLKWAKRNSYVLFRLACRIIKCAVGGGLLHSFNVFLYRLVGTSYGHMIPMMLTYIVLTCGDHNFRDGYRIMGNVVYAACGFEICRRVFVSGTVGFPATKYFVESVLNPLLEVIYPPYFIVDVIKACFYINPLFFMEM